MKLRLASLEDTGTLLPLMRAYHEFEGIDATDAERLATIEPLLAGEDNLGQVWLIETAGGTVGYIALCYGYSIEFGGRDAFLDELFIVETERGRGLGRRALERVKAEAARNGVKALHLEVARENTTAKNFYGKAGFQSRERFHLMSCRLGDDA
jgi:GNAT superfamily N-acetyltransferase